MKVEIEFKYVLRPNDIEKLLDYPLLKGHVSEEHHLISHYFDTEDRWLYSQGYALRVREQEGQYIQTLKARGSTHDALHERQEWERPIDLLPVDPEEIPVPFIRQAVKDFLLTNRLQCLFTTDFMRRSWFIDLGDARVEIAIDQGKIIKGKKSEKICELEIELLSGDKSIFIQFAENLANTFNLISQIHNKAERANQL